MDDRTALRLIGEALDGGVNLFDTAPNYAQTNSERLLGVALRGRRDKVVIVSKFGHPPEGAKDFSVPRFWRSIEASLKRLQTDYLDVLLLHNPPEDMYRGTDPLWEALEEAKREGKIRHYGASLDFAREVDACLDNTGSEVLEILFNVLHQDVRLSFAHIRQKHVGTIVKVPLDSGWLTGRFNEASTFNDIRSRWSAVDISRRSALVSQLDWLTADGTSLAHQAIGFLLSYAEVSCVIPGIRTSDQLRQNLAAAGRRVAPDVRDRLERFWESFTDNGRDLLCW